MKDCKSALGVPIVAQWLRLLWLWCRPEATTPIRLLAWEPPICHGGGPKIRQKDKKKKKKKRRSQVSSKRNGFLNHENLTEML